MPPKGSSPRTLDLFEVTLTIPTPSFEPTRVSAKPPALASVSDAELAQQLGNSSRKCSAVWKGVGVRRTLETAMQEARASLERLAPRHATHTKPVRSAKASPPLQAGQRKAVRAALLAGVAPTQVAKHFGLSLAAVRKVLAEAA